uniref:Beta-glucosidase n=1 Tax=Acrobeloides nanus TaxID=290746 RepID=A0A914DUN9_9BILA
MIDTIDKRSQSEGRITSRLPEFTKEEIEFIKGTADFIGLNYYASKRVRSRYPEEYTPDRPADILDGGYKVSADSRWKQNNPPNGWIFLYPDGLRKQLNQFRTDYGNPKIIITENGCMDTKGEWLNDVSRIEYIREHMIAVSKAIQDGCNVVGYTVWSLMDSFEWWDGFQAKFGLYHVDFNDPNRKRTPKASALWYKNVIKEKAIEPDDSFVNSKI